MPSGFYYKRKPFRSKYAGDLMNDEIRKELKRLGEQVVALYLAPIVENWDSEVRFVVNAQATKNKILMTITAKGDALAIDRWNMVDSKGRRGGVTITASNPSGVMRFQEGYVRKTGLGVAFISSSLGGAPGSRYGKWIATKEVTQGDVDPGNYTEKAQKDYFEPNAKRDLYNTYQRVRYRLRQENQ